MDLTTNSSLASMFTDQTSGDSKIPSIMYYGEGMEMKAAGATAATEDTDVEAECEGWLKVQYFKMHMRPAAECEGWLKVQYFKMYMRPAGMTIDTKGLEISPLPQSMTPTTVMGDFLGYLYSETVKYIRIHHSNSADLLKSVKDRIKFVLSHPNGWAGLPQQRMREAAVLGKLVKDSEEARAKISFVSEGEASALSCLAGGFCPPNLDRGYRFMIADLGGGTLDMTSYEVTNSSPLCLKELTSSDCQFAGSVFVNNSARNLVQKLLRGSQYDNPEILKEAIDDHFETSTKRQFKDERKISWLRVGNRDENNARLGVRQGRLRIDGKDVASCFERSISEALKMIKAQIARCGGKSMPVWLVGGFAASDWLFLKLEDALRSDGVEIRRPTAIDLSKAVAHGNVLYSLENIVSSRVTRCTYGLVCSTAYDKNDSQHRRRKHLQYTNLKGQLMMPGKFDIIVKKLMMPGKFDIIVKKNNEVKEASRFSRSYHSLVEDISSARRIKTRIHSFADEDPVPKWYDENEGM
ncbi:hypothetical protein A7U60_g7645 [Sanghuangporus baumii]|uniref:Uncharacterized protein n=1 Tax=Sanghuangporus baumii TaxID=108892 RepID=A0A9Q5N9E6_SANBA|nr:hypothetical protein A7U60_g7645 [Sanghuangporus baumii]